MNLARLPFTDCHFCWKLSENRQMLMMLCHLEYFMRECRPVVVVGMLTRQKQKVHLSLTWTNLFFLFNTDEPCNYFVVLPWEKTSKNCIVNKSQKHDLNNLQRVIFRAKFPGVLPLKKYLLTSINFLCKERINFTLVQENNIFSRWTMRPINYST